MLTEEKRPTVGGRHTEGRCQLHRAGWGDRERIVECRKGEGYVPFDCGE